MRNAQGETLYIKVDKNIQIQGEKVRLKDIAAILCTDTETGNFIKTLRIPQVRQGKAGRQVMSLLELVEVIEQEVSGLQINNLGETEFILTRKKAYQPSPALSWMKTILTSVLAFVGAAFTIMTFNNDVDIPKLFGQLYQQFTGQASDGFTVLEAAYSIGVGAGILLFFNHFGRHKITADPTPFEIELRLYEDDIDTTIMESDSRRKKC